MDISKAYVKYMNRPKSVSSNRNRKYMVVDNKAKRYKKRIMHDHDNITKHNKKIYNYDPFGSIYNKDFKRFKERDP